METTLILIRHGESSANGKGFFAGHLDIELSEKGEKQAALTARYVAENYKVDKIYSSDLKRAYATAKPLAQAREKEIVATAGLREIYAGTWQGLCFDELQTRYADSYGVWLRDIGNAACPSGETVKELAARIWEAVLDIVKENEGKTVAVVTHATPIRTLLCRWKGLPLSEMKNVPWVSNASVTVVKYRNGEWTVEKESADEQLAEMKTSFPANV
ncbi:MAG: histidine phosphatase family protein [Clostridia bacterium]|nr:histidine phosphatase family protein [Clostridia bacterium]